MPSRCGHQVRRALCLPRSGRRAHHRWHRQAGDLRGGQRGGERDLLAISAFAGDGFAVEGANDSLGFPAIAGINQAEGPGLAAQSDGHGPQLLLALESSAPAGPPGSTREPVGSGSTAQETCGCAPPTPLIAKWTRLLREDTAVGRTCPITPFRALDTRATGGRPSDLPPSLDRCRAPKGRDQVVTLDLAGVAPIPASAAGVVGNLTAVTPSFSGYLAARPSGTAAITTSLNFPAGVAALANAFTSQLGPAGLTITGSGTTANTYHLVVDITAYIT